jgi:hypothetical protein
MIQVIHKKSGWIVFRDGLDTSEINITPKPGSELRFLGFPERGSFTIPTVLLRFLQTFHAKDKKCGNILSDFTAVLQMAQFAA